MTTMTRMKKRKENTYPQTMHSETVSKSTVNCKSQLIILDQIKVKFIRFDAIKNRYNRKKYSGQK